MLKSSTVWYVVFAQLEICYISVTTVPGVGGCKLGKSIWIPGFQLVLPAHAESKDDIFGGNCFLKEYLLCGTTGQPQHLAHFMRLFQ